VRDDVYLIDGVNFPFDDESFDVIIVVDMLEHLEDDKQFMNELERILKPGGRIILNTPNHKPFSPLRGFRELIGQGDAEHGHVRAGYSLSDVEAILPRTLEVIKTWTYSRIFSESIDTAIVCAYRIISARKKPSNLNDNSEEQVSKGLVITEEKLKSFEKSFALYSKIYPLVKAVSLLDKLIPFVPGFMRLVVLKKN
jgi:SAM-dependent methyltransferase